VTRAGKRWLGVLAGALGGLLLAVFWVTQPFVFASPLPVQQDDVDAATLHRHVSFLADTTRHRDAVHPATLERAASYVEAQLKAAGGRVRSQVFEVDGQSVRNVIASFGPEGAPRLVIGAHYDSESKTMGADDNASGVAGLLAIAEAFQRHPPTLPVEVVAYTLEEPPYFATDNMGSRQHARSLADAGSRPDLVLVLEMIGYFSDAPASQHYPVPGMTALYPERGDFIAVVGKLSAAGAVRRVKSAMRGASDLPVYSINAPAWIPGVDFSDHASYWPYDIPAVMITDTADNRNPHYHRASDTPEKLDYERMRQVVKGVLAVIRHFEESRKQA
jgi:Zn-dependent M28 family amino/carboxypeptidase